MNFKKACTALALASAFSVASANDQSVAFNVDLAQFWSTPGSLFSGDSVANSDVISFTGLSSGLYDFTLTLSAQYINLDSATLNGVSGTQINMGKWTFVGIDGTGSPDFQLVLTGSAYDMRAAYSGELSVSLVPEPETYALMIAGLAAVGFVSRRRKA